MENRHGGEQKRKAMKVMLWVKVWVVSASIVGCLVVILRYQVPTSSVRQRRCMSKTAPRLEQERQHCLGQ